MEHFYELKKLLINKGANFVGICAINNLDAKVNEKYASAISIGLAMNAKVVAEIEKGQSINYYNECIDIYKKLDVLGHISKNLLESKGYITNYSGAIQNKKSNSYPINIPHSKIATECGVGWIGKCNILITEKYGASVRLTSILSNMKYKGNSKAITKSQCGDCLECVKICPAGAPTGNSWTPGIPEEEVFDSIKCGEEAKKRTMQNKGLEYTFCGKCIASCPYTKRYINRF